jgi:hypothetical protein
LRRIRVVSRKEKAEEKRPANEFEQALQGALSGGAVGTSFDSVITVLQQVAAGIHRAIFKDTEAVYIRLEPGFVVNMGQQISVVVSADGFKDTLFRAYVPQDGFPVTLDFFGDTGLVCDDEQTLRTRLVQFLKDKDVQMRLKGLHTMVVRGVVPSRLKRRVEATGGGRGRGSAA